MLAGGRSSGQAPTSGPRPPSPPASTPSCPSCPFTQPCLPQISLRHITPITHLSVDTRLRIELYSVPIPPTFDALRPLTSTRTTVPSLLPPFSDDAAPMPMTTASLPLSPSPRPTDPEAWRVAGEGSAHIVFRYTGPTSPFSGLVLRIPKTLLASPPTSPARTPAKPSSPFLPLLPTSGDLETLLPPLAPPQPFRAHFSALLGPGSPLLLPTPIPLTARTAASYWRLPADSVAEGAPGIPDLDLDLDLHSFLARLLSHHAPTLARPASYYRYKAPPSTSSVLIRRRHRDVYGSESEMIHPGMMDAYPNSLTHTPSPSHPPLPPPPPPPPSAAPTPRKPHPHPYYDPDDVDADLERVVTLEQDAIML